MKLLVWTSRRFYSGANFVKPWKKKRSFLKAGVFVGGSMLAGGLSWKYYMENLHQAELSTDYFVKYRISKKLPIDEDHYLVQLHPLKPQKTNMWSAMNSTKLWSVEVKQPEIMVVRSYTPLPLTIQDDGSIQVLKDGDSGNGILTFYIRQYEQGEVARWINRLPLGHILELRGPYVEYEFPEIKDEIKRDRQFLWNSVSKTREQFKNQPFDILFLTAGTGIVPLLQMTLTESPFRGKIGVYHSCKTLSELGPLNSLIHKLSVNNRIEFKACETANSSSNILTITADLPPPGAYKGLQPYKELSHKLSPVVALVCGPDGFISTVAGPKFDKIQGPIKGILAQKGWDNNNAYKL